MIEQKIQKRETVSQALACKRTSQLTWITNIVQKEVRKRWKLFSEQIKKFSASAKLKRTLTKEN